MSEPLALRIRTLLRRRRGVSEKTMFGGIAFLLDGNMCVGDWKDSLIVRVGLDRQDELLAEDHVSEFNVTGKAMRGWLLVAPEGVEDDEDLKRWIDIAAAFTRTLPAK